MAKSGESADGRRKFLKGAAVTAAALVGQGQVGGAQQPSADDHEHQAVPADVALRVKALESVLVEKEMVDRRGTRCCRRHLREQDRSPERRPSGRTCLGRSRLQGAVAGRGD